jgi:septum site-determining protein MinC
MVHAGSGGSRDAFIAALKLKPTQLRIADLIARSPDDPDRSGVFPEIASVREGMIEVNPLYERL